MRRLHQMLGMAVLLCLMLPRPLAAQENPPQRRVINAQNIGELVEVWRPVHDDSISDMAWSPDSTDLALNDFEGMIHIYEVASATRRREIDTRAAGAQTSWLSFTADSQQIIGLGTTLINGRNRGVVSLWKAADGSLVLVTVPFFVPLHRIEVVSTPTSDKAIANTNVVDLTSGEVLPLALGNEYSTVAISPDGQWVAEPLGGKITIYDVATGESVVALDLTEAIFTASDGVIPGMSFQATAFSTDGQKLVLVQGVLGDEQFNDTTFLSSVIFDLTSGGLSATLDGQFKAVHEPAFHPDGSLIAAYTCAAFVTAEQCATLAITFWETTSGGQVGQIALPADGPTVLDIEFSPDGTLLALRSSNGVIIYGVSSATE